MPNPLLLQVLWRATLAQHGDPSVSECVKSCLRDAQPLQEWVEHPFEDIHAGDRRAIPCRKDTASFLVSDILLQKYLRGHPKAANEGHLKTGQRK